MATNVTTDTELFLKNQLAVTEKHLEDNLMYIKRYNEETIPAKKIKIEEMNKKKLEKGKPLLEFNYKPIDPNTAEEVVGLRKKIEAYNTAIDLVHYGSYITINKGEFTLNDYIKFFESKEKTSTIRISCAEKRLEKNRKKLAENKKKNPKKYGSRPDLPEINKEIINEQRKLEHWQKVLKLLREKESYIYGIMTHNINIRTTTR